MYLLFADIELIIEACFYKIGKDDIVKTDLCKDVLIINRLSRFYLLHLSTIQ